MRPGGALSVVPRTVEFHRAHIKQKLNGRNTADLASRPCFGHEITNDNQRNGLGPLLAQRGRLAPNGVTIYGREIRSASLFPM